MKKVYSIALLAIIMIVCLQGYNVLYVKKLSPLGWLN